MSDTHAHGAGYVRDTMLPQSEPPLREKGAVKWLRENLFSSPLNAILTILSLIVVYLVLSGLVPWLLNSVWNAGSLSECRDVLALSGLGSHDGACFAVITDRWKQLMFGFYPSDEYWRPILAFILFFVALAPILFSEKMPSQLIFFSLAYPFIAVWLIWGGAIWTPILIALGFVAGYAALVYASRVAGSIVGVIAAIVVAIVWWMVLTPALSSGLDRMIGNGRIDGYQVSLLERAETLEPQIETLDAQIDEATKNIAAMVAEKDTLFKAALAAVENGAPSPDATAAYTAQLDEVMTARRAMSDLSVSRFQANEQARNARALLAAIDALPDQQQELADLRSQAVTAETAEQIDTLETAVSTTYSELGRLGLRPIESRDIGGFMLGIIIGVAGIVLSLPLGILLALGRQSPLLIINKICVCFIEVIRGVPLIVWLITASLLLNYFLPPGTNFDLMLRVIIMVTLFSAAYIAEVIRGGLAALPKGQYEGADSLGLGYWQSMRLIVLPQAMKISIPGIVNTFIGLFKDTTLVVFIGLLDPVGLSNAIRASTDWNGIYWELFVFIGLLFFIFCFSMGRYSLYLEKKLQREHR